MTADAPRVLGRFAVPALRFRFRAIYSSVSCRRRVSSRRPSGPKKRNRGPLASPAEGAHSRLGNGILTNARLHSAVFFSRRWGWPPYMFSHPTRLCLRSAVWTPTPIPRGNPPQTKPLALDGDAVIDDPRCNVPNFTKHRPTGGSSLRVRDEIAAQRSLTFDITTPHSRSHPAPRSSPSRSPVWETGLAR